MLDDNLFIDRRIAVDLRRLACCGLVELLANPGQIERAHAEAAVLSGRFDAELDSGKK